MTPRALNGLAGQATLLVHASPNFRPSSPGTMPTDFGLGCPKRQRLMSSPRTSVWGAPRSRWWRRCGARLRP